MQSLITTHPSSPSSFNAFALSAKAKQTTLERIDRACSLYYVTMGSIYAVCQTAMVDARTALREDRLVFRHQTKFHVNNAIAAYERWNIAMQRILKDRYQLWLDLSDSVDEEIKPLVTTLYYSIDNYFLKLHVPKSKIFSHMETALVLLDIARITFSNIFKRVHEKIGVDIAPLFAGADASDIFFHWQSALTAASKAVPGFPDVDVNKDPMSVQAACNVTAHLSAKAIYDRAGEYALRLNQDQWCHLPKEDRLRLKQNIPLQK